MNRNRNPYSAIDVKNFVIDLYRTKYLRRKKVSKSNNDIIIVEHKLELLHRCDVNPHRPRSAYFGEQFQLDASPHVWFGNLICFINA